MTAIQQDSTSKNIPEDQLITLCRAWGLIKYYHPAVNSKKIDWDKELLDFLYRNQSDVSIDTFINSSLDKLDLIFPPKVIITTDDIRSLLSNNYANIEKLKFLNDSRLYPIKPNFDWIKEDDNLSIELQFRLCNTILNGALDKIRNGKDKVLLKLKENPFSEQLNPDIQHRILALFRYWNIIHYFFPYKDYMDQPWDSVLPEKISVFLEADTRVKYINAIGELSAKTNDTHSMVRATVLPTNNLESSSIKTYKFIPFNFQEIDSTFYVTKSLIPALDMYKGLQVVAINNVPLESWKKYFAKLNGHSTPQALTNHFDHMISMTQFQDTCTVTFKIDGLNQTVTIHDGVSGLVKINSNYNESISNFKFVQDSIGYLNISEAKSSEVRKAFFKFKKTKGIIIDLRGYPEGMAIQMLPKHFSRRPINAAEYFYPSSKVPGAFIKAKNQENYFVENKILGIFKVFGLLPYKKLLPTFNSIYNGFVVVLINNEAVSAAETTGMIIKAYCEKEIFVGQPTMGSNGNIVFVNLPGNVRVSYSSLHWHYPDGTRLQRIGITPDIFVNESPKDFVQGKDPYIEAAIQWLNKH